MRAMYVKISIFCQTNGKYYAIEVIFTKLSKSGDRGIWSYRRETSYTGKSKITWLEFYRQTLL